MKAYFDPSGISPQAVRSEEGIRTLTQQFQGLFLQEMLKSMRKASQVMQSDLTSGMDTTFLEMMDNQMALSMAEDDAMGLTDLLMEQLSHGQGLLESSS
jgi:flagellar protein FlgJ